MTTDALAPAGGMLVIVAHPDDETFGCGSLLLHARSRGVRTLVLCATRGQAGELAPGISAPHGVAALRETELRQAAAALGVSEVTLLAYADSGMTGEPAPDTLSGAPFQDVVADVQAAVLHYRPDVVVTLDGGDGHRDHRRLRLVVEELARGADWSAYLSCLPRSLMHDWVRHHTGDEDAAAYIDLPDIGTPDADITTTIDTTAHLQTRRAAIALHASQTSPFDGLPDTLQRAFLAREHLIRLNPPWPGGPHERHLTGLHATSAAPTVEPTRWWNWHEARWINTAAKNGTSNQSLTARS